MGIGGRPGVELPAGSRSTCQLRPHLLELGVDLAGGRQLAQLAVDVVFAGAERGQILEGSAASSSPTASARAFMFSVLSRARCMASPTSAISSPTPVAASEIRTCASAAEYWALITSFFERNCSILVRSRCSDCAHLFLLLL